jgi:uncharacterized membrane protein
MMASYPRTLTVVAAIGAGVSGGVFFAFSTFVMKALGRLPDAQAVTAMNAINRAAPTPPFMLALFGSGAVSIALSVVAFRNLDQNWAPYVLIGSALYLVCVVVTVAYHVPHNDALALVDPRSPAAARAWAQYVSPWTAWNHVRTVTALTGATAFILGLRAA